MNCNFILLNKTKRTIIYINKQITNYPKNERVLKDNIERNMYEMIEYIFFYNINNTERIKEKYLKDLLVKLSMLDYYITMSFEKRLVSEKKYKSISMYLLEIKRIIYGLINNVSRIT